MTDRLAVVTTHPIQYNAPWFRHIARLRRVDLHVLYLWDFGVSARVDPQFGRVVQWDVPLLGAYSHEFVPNTSGRPGTDRLTGLWNPSLATRVRAFAPTAVLLLTYNYASIYHFLMHWTPLDAPLLFRGDSHRLAAPRGVRARARHAFISRVFRRFDACLYVGQANRRYFEAHDVAASRLFYAPHAVDNERFIAETDRAESDAAGWRAELRIPRHHRVVLFAGKFEAKKRPLDLLRAFVEAGVADASLLFVGDGALEPELRAAAGGDRRIVFAPFQNQRAMPRTYAIGDLLVLPSYGPGETWGLAVNEAMCMGRPVIVSSHVGCAEDLVNPHRNGLVFPAGDVAALAAALREALADDARLRAWGRASRDRIEHFSYEQTTHGLLSAVGATRRRSPPRREPSGAQAIPADDPRGAA